MPKKINKAKLFRNLILILLVVGSVGLYFSNRFVKSKGFEGLGDFISTYRENKALAADATPELMELKISKEDYKFLKSKRQEALDRGIQINEGDNYVKCKIKYNGEKIKGELRLKGHMTDHLEGDKWSFRVKSDEEVMGMYRFSLQNPATRNYAYEWVYHALLKNEGIIHLKYDFIHLKLNDKDLGIYAIEEHFGQHVIRDNNRPKGAILRWNPELYWVGRINELDNVYINEDYSTYANSFSEAYDEGVVKRDSVLIQTYQIGASLLESFRRGESTTSQVFDVEKMARFHAVIDLVGGYHSLDWSDLKFYYNSETNRIEPVGYESFSVRETVKIAGQRTPDDYAQTGFNYHDQLFADPIFFKAYIQELERICDEAYFKKFTESIEKELNLKRGILAHEFAYIKFSFQPYYDNIALIRKNLELPKAFHAFLEEKSDSTVRISITPVSDYPIEILELTVNDKAHFPIDSAFILPAKARDTYAHYFSLSFHHDSDKLKKLKLQARILGSNRIFEVEVSDLPAYKGAIKWEEKPPTTENNDTALVWWNSNTASFKRNLITIQKPIYIAENQILVINSGQKIQFEGEGQLIIEGEVKFLGHSDNEILVTAHGDLKRRILLENGKLLAVYTTFYELPNDFIQAINTTLNFQKCSIADTETNFITALNSSVTLIDCGSGSMNSLGFFDRSIVRIRNFTAKKGDTFLTAYGSDVELYSSNISNYTTYANLNYSSNMGNWGAMLSEIGVVGLLNNDSHLGTFGGEIKKSKIGYKIDVESTDYFSSYVNQKTKMELEKIEIQGKV